MVTPEAPKPLREISKEFTPEGFISLSLEKDLIRDNTVEVKTEFGPDGLPTGAMRTDQGRNQQIWLAYSFDEAAQTASIQQFEGGKEGRKSIQLIRQYKDGWIIADKFFNPDGELMQEIKFDRDSEGRVIREEVYWGEKQEPTQISTFTYNEEGLLLHSSVKETPGKKMETTFEAKADAQGNWIESTHFRDGQAIINSTREITYY